VTVLEAFLTTPDWDAAVRFAESHPELRNPFAILALADAAVEANQTGKTNAARYLAGHAGLLCGPSWSEGPDIVARLAAAYTALQQAPTDPATVTAAIEVTRPITAGHAAAAHPTLLPRLLNTTSAILAQTYAATGQRGLLDEAVRAQRKAIAVTPATSADRPGYLNNLAIDLRDLYAATGVRGLLDEAVGVQREAVAVTPATSADRPAYLNNLGNHLTSLYAATGERGLLDEAVGVQREAVAVTPATSADRPGYLTNLGNSLADLYAATGERGVLDEAVRVQREALAATPASNTDRPGRLNNLSKCLGELYAATGERGVLDEAVGVQREAVAATPATSTGRPAHLSSLANHLCDLYAATGERGVLDEAVGVQREALAATPAASTDRPGRLTNLGNSLADLYAATGERGVLDEAVRVQREALAATSLASTGRPAQLNNLAYHLRELYAATGERGVLDEAVRVQREALAATPATSTARPGYLNNLGNHLTSLYAATGDRGLLDEAVRVQREAVAVTPATSTERPRHLNNLALRLADLYRATGERGVLDEAVGVQREAVAATPATSTGRPAQLNNLANHLRELHGATGERGVLEEAVGVVEGVRGGGPGEQVTLARTRAGLARQGDNPVAAASELEMAHGAFDEEIARLRATNDPVRLRDLAQRVDGLLGDLAATHIVNGDAHRALELLESDRVWLRAPGPGTASQVPDGPVAVAWVVPSQWETAVVTAPDATSPPDSFERYTVAVTRNALRSAVVDAINAVRHRDSDAADQAVTRLIDLTSRVVATFPQASRLLVVPLGVAALLPFAAAPLPTASAPLVDHTAVTLAPSLAWALAAHRARPAGRGHVGAFHPGTPPFPVLSLGADRDQFETLVGPNVLDQPTAEEVLAALEPGMDIGHFSCHGTYNHLNPLDSHLLLGTELRLRAVLNHRHAPWLTNLSACETGVPDFQALEQLVSFPMGFLLGGAAHVFASLWPVGNRAATTLNGHAYQLLANGAHPAEALRQAVQHLRHPSTPPAAAVMAHARTEPAVRSLAEDDDQRPSGHGARDETHSCRWAPFVHYGSPW
jgi:hypothetical protein